MARNGKVILAKNINMDRNYKNVIDYNETQMLQLLTSSKHFVVQDNKFSFLRNTGEIQVSFSYSQCFNSNYMAFQNPNYSNKWFFAFIDKIEYISENCVRINYTIDAWSTWYGSWKEIESFVIREHVSDDTIGKHTIDEGIGTGEYNSTNLQPNEKFNFKDDSVIVIATSELLSGMNYATLNQVIPNGLYYIAIKNDEALHDILKAYYTDFTSDPINSVFIAPSEFFSSWENIKIGDNTYEYSTTIKYSYQQSVTIDKVDYLNRNYKPKNNKLYCYPYNYLQVSNNSGEIVNYKYEEFRDITNNSIINPQFSLIGTISPGCSFRLYPVNYKNIVSNYDEGLNYGKLPIGSFQSDVYTMWLTQNGANMIFDLSTEFTGNLLDTLVKDTSDSGKTNASPIPFYNNLVSIGSSMLKLRNAMMLPNQARGNVNNGDVNYQFGLTNMTFKRISIKNEYAKIIDDYFTRFGYTVNELKKPNINTRPIFNYIQIDSSDELGKGSVPNEYMEIINNSARNGVTIWHNHDNIGNYSLDNSIQN